MENIPSYAIGGFEKHLDCLSIESESTLKGYEKSVLYLIEVIQNLKEEIVVRGFQSKKEEIHFFKHIKPIYVSKLIYFTVLYNIESQIALLDNKKLNKFYKRELLKIQLFFEDNKDFYHYYTSRSSHLDKFYFRRKKHNIRLKLEPYLIDSDPQFSTSHDYKLAQLMANEQLKSMFESRLIQMDPIEFELPDIINEDILPWTATKRDMIEMIHAFYYSGVFNYGKATLKQITEFFERTFSMKLGNFYAEFAEMKERKGDPFYFINRLKKGLWDNFMNN